MRKFDLGDYPPPFSLGTTSYIIPDEILPNVRYLADKVSDVELVLFEVDDGPNNLPNAAALQELGRLSREHAMSYTVHLPLDLHLGADGGEADVSLRKARAVIELTRELSPQAYVVHLDGREVKENNNPADLNKWTEQACRSLEIAGGWAGGPQLLAVENLEGYPPEFWGPVLERIPASRCVDIGHLWLDRHDPLPFLERWLPHVPRDPYPWHRRAGPCFVVPSSRCRTGSRDATAAGATIWRNPDYGGFQRSRFPDLHRGAGRQP